MGDRSADAGGDARKLPFQCSQQNRNQLLHTCGRFMGEDLYLRRRDADDTVSDRRSMNVAASLLSMKVVFILLATLLATTHFATAQAVSDRLKHGFENPPNSARPRVWWHWMNGNVTREGIRLDLEWMHRVGLGGFQNFDAALYTPKVVQRRIVYMTPEWKSTFLYATKLANRLGLEEAIASSPGWSETGGPWVPPAEAMKKYVWSETQVEGGEPFTGRLPEPPGTTGPFQDVPLVPDPVMPGDKAPAIPTEFYRDSTVVAYRLPEGDVPIANFHPSITSSADASGIRINPTLLSDGDYAKSVDLPSAPMGQAAWIRYTFEKPVTIQAVTLVLAAPAAGSAVSSTHGDSEVYLEASDDGQKFRRLLPIGAGDIGTTRSFFPVTARVFQVAFVATAARPPLPADDDPDGWMGVHVARTSAPHFERITELVLSPGARVQYFQEKAAFVAVDDTYRMATPRVAPGDAIDLSSVTDLTGKMQADGRLEWTPPAGRWVILRMGYSLLGITNHPATGEATGLEVDKLNRSYVKHYMDHYLDSYKSTVGSDWMGRRGVKYVVTDSWEAGAQNWTENILAEFKKRRGYDPHPWLPVLTGHVVESAEESDAFLWDFRKTISDMTADEHYGQVEASLKARGLGHYGESHESGRAMIADGMEVKKLDEVPMGAMWVQRPGVNNELFGYDADDRESASVAHIYGQNLAAAESMTAVHAPWAWSPATLKPTADKEMSEGINRFVIHCSVHQPLIGKAPGLGLGPYGQWFNRNETWADEAGSWVNYLTRSSYLLQQGKFGADILYFYGEDSNVTAIFGNKLPNVPEGYGFDYVNADALLHMFTVEKGKLTTASGMSYKVLALDPYSEHMSLPVLRRIRDLVWSGAIIAGPRPLMTPSLTDDKAEFNSIVAELWGDAPGVHLFGKGRVYEGMPLADVLVAMKVEPDFTYNKPRPDTRLLFVHRRLADGDIYFVDNRNDRDETVNATFRVTGKQAELWHAETGESEPASYTIANARTTIPLHLGPWGAVFVVFRKPARSATRLLAKQTEEQLATVDGPWTVSFEPGRGAPASITLDSLSAWSENADPGVKYFSGIGTYSTKVIAPPAWFRRDARVWIDLGDVKNLAVVTVNGRSLGTVWHQPFRVDATEAMRPGINNVTVKVINAWVNRMIGDQKPGGKRYTFTVIHPYTAASALLPSGLLGPVRISSVSVSGNAALFAAR